MRVKAIDENGETVKACSISDNYRSTQVYTRVAAGDASTHGGRVVAWQFVDRVGRVVETIQAPAYR